METVTTIVGRHRFLFIEFNRSNNLPYAAFALACEKFVAFLYSLKLDEMPEESRKSNSSLLVDLRQSTGIRTSSSRFRSSLSESYKDALKKHKPNCVFTYSEIIGQLTDELDKQDALRIGFILWVIVDHSIGQLNFCLDIFFTTDNCLVGDERSQ